jgi:hypothetical protein
MKNDSDITKLQLPTRIQIYLKVEKEEQNQKITQTKEQISNCTKNSCITNFRQSSYSCADSNDVWAFRKTPANPPLNPPLEL